MLGARPIGYSHDSGCCAGRVYKMDERLVNGDPPRLIIIQEDSRPLDGENAEVGGRDQLGNKAHEQGEIVMTSPKKYFESQGYAAPDSVQQEIDKWVEFYDNLKSYLQNGTSCIRSMPKSAENFSLGSDGNIYRTKPPKDGLVFPKTPVIRNYEDRLRICKDIHVNTGVEGIHHRRDKMMELVGQQYYWKGQRRDICECIASCEICSSGLGARRKSKPPRQARDVRSPAKLQKLSTSPFTVSSSITTANPFMTGKSEAVMEAPTKPFASLATVSAKSSLSTATAAGKYQSTSDTASVRSELGREERCDFDPLGHTLSDISVPVPVSTCSTMLLDSSFSMQGFQIFTTINEPAVNGDANACSSASITNSTSQPTAKQSSTVMAAAAPVLVTQSDVVEDNFSSPCEQQQPKTVTASSSSESSIYQLLFQLPSEPNAALFPSVIDAMHMAIQHTTDPTELSKACGDYLRQSLGLGSIYSVAVAPNLAAAYIIAVAAGMLRVDPLSINQQLTSSPLAIIHDACCLGNPLKACSPLIGAINWNLGGVNTPMDKSMLAMALANNRVAAVLYQPYGYPKQCQRVPLRDVSEVCHTRNTVTVIVDATEMPLQELSLVKFITSVKNFFINGADVVLLPKTVELRGPPQTCVLVGRSAILGEALQNIALLQSQICLPLTCTSYELVGTVVAYKTVQVDTMKQTLGTSTTRS